MNMRDLSSSPNTGMNLVINNNYGSGQVSTRMCLIGFGTAWFWWRGADDIASVTGKTVNAITDVEPAKVIKTIALVESAFRNDVYNAGFSIAYILTEREIIKTGITSIQSVFNQYNSIGSVQSGIVSTVSNVGSRAVNIFDRVIDLWAKRQNQTNALELFKDMVEQSKNNRSKTITESELNEIERLVESNVDIEKKTITAKRTEYESSAQLLREIQELKSLLSFRTNQNFHSMLNRTLIRSIDIHHPDNIIHLVHDADLFYNFGVICIAEQKETNLKFGLCSTMSSYILDRVDSHFEFKGFSASILDENTRSANLTFKIHDSGDIVNPEEILVSVKKELTKNNVDRHSVDKIVRLMKDARVKVLKDKKTLIRVPGKSIVIVPTPKLQSDVQEEDQPIEKEKKEEEDDEKQDLDAEDTLYGDDTIVIKVPVENFIQTQDTPKISFNSSMLLVEVKPTENETPKKNETQKKSTAKEREKKIPVDPETANQNSMELSFAKKYSQGFGASVNEMLNGDKQMQAHQESETKQEGEVSTWESLKNPSFTMILSGTALIFIACALYFTYKWSHKKSKIGDVSEIDKSTGSMISESKKDSSHEDIKNKYTKPKTSYMNRAVSNLFMMCKSKSPENGIDDIYTNSTNLFAICRDFYHTSEQQITFIEKCRRKMRTPTFNGSNKSSNPLTSISIPFPSLCCSCCRSRKNEEEDEEQTLATGIYSQDCKMFHPVNLPHSADNIYPFSNHLGVNNTYPFIN